MQTFTQRHAASVTRGVSPLFDRLFPERKEALHGDWVVNKTGRVSYRAEVFPLEGGAWGMAILCRTGWHSGEYTYEWCRVGLNAGPRRHQVFREACLLAEQLATLRYRYH
ncbi:hypothetical protein [Serratia oryzae]|uniref:hypothetical protein n=1 Tax=Serratia oryzae TaxID=2034155 RepID=UPI0012E13A00|nr:hypothetical protein [Serratia oryzae]